MNTLKIIEGQDKNDLMSWVDRHYPNVEKWKYEGCVERCYDWHKQSIIQILQSEIERKRGMKKEYTESFHVDEVEKNQAVKYKNHGEVGFNRCLKEDIAHLSVLLDSLK